jgi:hypothetical protein
MKHILATSKQQGPAKVERIFPPSLPFLINPYTALRDPTHIFQPQKANLIGYHPEYCKPTCHLKLAPPVPGYPPHKPVGLGPAAAALGQRLLLLRRS